jgi:hypothetical protein
MVFSGSTIKTVSCYHFLSSGFWVVDSSGDWRAYCVCASVGIEKGAHCSLKYSKKNWLTDQDIYVLRCQKKFIQRTTSGLDCFNKINSADALACCLGCVLPRKCQQFTSLCKVPMLGSILRIDMQRCDGVGWFKNEACGLL